MRAHQDDIGGLHQKHPQIAVPTLADPTKHRPPTPTELAWYQADPSGKVTAPIEYLALPIAATIAVEIGGPIPGMVMMLALFSSDLLISSISEEIALIRSSTQSQSP